MKALITKRSIIIASASVLIALISLVSINLFSSAGPVTGFANTVTRPVRALATTVARTFGNIFASIYRYDELEKRHEEVLQRLARYEADLRESEALALENERLRRALDFRERRPDYTQEMATLSGWNSDNWSHSFTINKGYMNSNITTGMGVATEYGVLIGQVSDVGPTISTVISVLDTTFSAAVYVGGDTESTSDGTATAKGSFSHMRNGYLILDYIDEDLIVLNESTIVTSGLGGVFPPGLTIGEVVQVFDHPSGIGRYATIRPMRDIETLQVVFVILDFENPE
ncbi:MAG: rod shape-determining protein MreC [Oscillospiraceae bacterium]|nr:rod shape-determining protein MreC [Oscillospiraceae bacterium]